MQDAETIRWLDGHLATNPQSPAVDLKYFSAYVPEFGFKFGVERLHNMKERMPYVVITSVIPPGSLYQSPPRNGPDVHMFLDYDVDSPWNSIQFLEEMLEYVNLPISERFGFIIDVKGVRINGNTVSVVDVGWAFCPIQVSLVNEDGSFSSFVNSGLHALPLWQGPVLSDLVQYACRTEDPYTVLSNERSLKKLEPASVIVRVHDKQREQIPVLGDYRGLNNQYLPQGDRDLAKYAFSVEKHRQTQNQQARVGAAPSMTLGEMKSKIVQAVSARFDLK